ncbi:D-alanyl-D-alanine carboxypeptidase/D-alanyl-D-alanine-endopeptidase [Carboxydochorda subterranea]|uniref:D-alanyl-D-alanine carboxypeptidase/D-alanyl-D-alanine-endopeptidase n=1 Tax=Carboxydichorda subterranea TaxID=3109565 RepID=A0ABZ1BY13_9FIRM|nr:D-alanyl-D-alanine carboxypeptidase/D-alanyl-D-alanine-endopeptidase [Limnochorda sp. L945t]WRP17431.1 D-alanyl-D-alanine carboxypeptidase/D-alanyl-D-alanine-endopeptidase [Limnochorda sp. L945t]
MRTYTAFVVSFLLAIAWPLVVTPAFASQGKASQLKDRADVQLQALRERLDQILSDPGLSGAWIGARVISVDTGRVLYAINPDKRFVPASNMKLFTAAAALDVLGPDFRFVTRVVSGGRPSGGVLEGDLYLVGGGDPTVLPQTLEELAAAFARTSGVRKVTGRLVADDTWFDDIRLGEDWLWDDEPSWTTPQISALTLAPNEDFDVGTVIVEVRGTTPGRPAEVHLVPDNAYVTLDARVVTGAEGGARDVSFTREHGTNRIIVSGTLPPGATARQWVTVWEPTLYAADVFRLALERAGVRVEGPTVRGHAPEKARQVEWARRQSPPLSDILVVMLKLSNNGIAETLVKTMGAVRRGEGSWKAGLDVMRDSLRSMGIDPSAMLLRDGSGKSHSDLVTPAQVTQLLAAMWPHPHKEPFYRALPVAGAPDRLVGGTLRSRMRGTLAEGNARAKTGSLTAVHSLSGYVRTRRGELLAFSMLFNHYLGPDPVAVEDGVVAALAAFDG